MKTETKRLAWLRPELRELVPYAVSPITVPVAVNANESAQSLWDLPEIRQALLEELQNTAPQHYPKPYADELRSLIADYVGRTQDEVLLANGGDDILGLMAQAFIAPGDTALIHTPTFEMYQLGVNGMGGRVVAVPDTGFYEHDVEGMLAAIAKEQPKIVYLCNPNNPTGRPWQREELERLIEAAPGIVLLDEAYMEFAAPEVSLIPAIDTYDNLFVLRTLSKAFGLAGARLGYIVSQKENINLLSRVKPPYNLNAFSQALGRVALRYKDAVLAGVSTVCSERDRMIADIEALPDIAVVPSKTNFLFVTSLKATAIYEALLEEGILVKYYGAGHPLHGGLRITVTTESVNTRILKTLAKVVKP